MNIGINRRSSLLRNTLKPVWFIIAIFFYTATIALGNLLLIRPQLHQYKSLQVQRDELDGIFNTVHYSDVDDTIESLQTQINIYKNQQQEFVTKIFNRQDISLLLGELNRIVGHSQLTMNYIHPLPPSSKIMRKYQKLPITLRLNGSYQNFMQFLKELESAKYWLLLDSFDISPTKVLGENNYAVNIYTIVE